MSYAVVILRSAQRELGELPSARCAWKEAVAGRLWVQTNVSKLEATPLTSGERSGNIPSVAPEKGSEARRRLRCLYRCPRS